MPNTKLRVVGSGFTTFNYRGRPLAFLERFRDTGQAPIVPPESITPLDARHPIEVVTPRVLTGGNIECTVRELWNAPVWNQLAGLEGSNDIVDVYERISQEPAEVTCQMVVQIPNSNMWRGKTYHGCVITGIDDGEEVFIGALSIARNLTIFYTHTTPFTINA